MDYYASWPAWKMPKWLGATLGVGFSVIVVVCGWLIVDLTRTPPRRPLAPTAAARTAVASARPGSTPSVEVHTDKAGPAFVEAGAVKKLSRGGKGDLSPARKRAILAKHDSKTNRQAKTELDRLLGL